MTLLNRLKKAWYALIDKPHIIYICDRKRCDNCEYPTCIHTSDINHAANFIKVLDDFYEEVGEVTNHVQC